MNLGKLPPFMAMTLGLLSCEAGMNACLSEVGGPYYYTTTETDNPMLSSTGIASGTLGQTETSADSGSGTDTESTVTGPCLGAPMDSSGTETSTGTGTGTDTGTDTDTDTDASSGTEGGSSSSGGMLDELPPPEAARAAAVERVLSREILPTDVLERLRTLVSKAKG